MSKIAFAASMIIALGACSVHSVRYEAQPTTPALPKFLAAETSNSPSNEPWWQTMQRPELNSLVEQSLQLNQTLAQALARVKQASAVTVQTRSGRRPQLDLNGSISNSWYSGEDQRSTREFGGALAWELDAFNRIAAAVEADSFTEVARMEDMNALRLSLSADVANAYFAAVAAQRRLELLKDQVRIDNELLGLLDLRWKSGIGTNVEVLQQQSRVAESESLVPQTLADLRLYENRLDVLAGQMPDGRDRVAQNENLEFPATLPAVGVPAGLILNRPDLRASRAALLAADANIGAAIADRLPQITLSGTYVHSDTAAFVGPLALLSNTFAQPLLDWGRRKAEVERNRAVYEE
ncbi:MAG: TolC family protein, partial [Pseudomonadales bacterium]|nr:TolC family protein [Pseudomonadales bacterium]